MQRLLNVTSWLCLLGLLLPNLKAGSAALPSETEFFARTRETLPTPLKAAAERDHVDLSGMGAFGDMPLVGDAVAVLITTTRGKTQQQWLAQFRRGTATPREQKDAGGKKTTKYLSWGSVITFKSDVEALELWIAGPVNISNGASAAFGPAAPAKRTRILVPGDYLRLGLDKAALAQLYIVRRSEELRKAEPTFSEGHIYFLDKPIPPDKIELAKPIATKIGFTPEIERAWLGGSVALQAFYGIAGVVPELHEIALIAIDKPSVWELTKLATGSHFITAFGGGSSALIQPDKSGLLPVHSDSYAAPFQFSLAQETIVYGEMVVTAPRPPLDVSAGIVALRALHPKDTSRKVEVTVIATQRGSASL